MHKLTLLEEKQIFGDKALDVIKKRGTRAGITDFAILLGGDVNNVYHVDGYNTLDKRTGWYWTKTDDQDNDTRIVDCGGDIDAIFVNARYSGVRPVLPLCRLQSIPTNGVSGRAKDGILEVEYGYYPRSAAPQHMQFVLENAYNFRKSCLYATGKKYTTDSRRCDIYGKVFEPQSHVEYHYNGKKYVRVRANSYDDRFTLSNGGTYKRGSMIWIEVEPVRWLVDEKSKLMITEELIVSGVQFKYKRDYKGNFSKTDIKKFMDEYLSKELFQSQIINVEKNNDIMEEYFILIDQLRLSGYSSEQIRKITNSMLKKSENTNSSEIINCKKKAKCYRVNKNK